MDIKDFRKKVKKIAEKEGKTPISPKEVFGKTAQQFKQMSENNYGGFKEAWTQNLDYHNNTLSLIYGLVIGIFSAVFMQSLFEILKIMIKEEFYFFIFTFLVMISFFILIIISFFLFKEMKQADNMRKRNEKGMKESLKMKKDSEKILEDLNNLSAKADYLSEGLGTPH